jgi:hypothetical protein
MKDVIEKVLTSEIYRDEEALTALVSHSMNAGAPWQGEPI